MRIDWADEATWPAADFDLVIGADLLYHPDAAAPLARLLGHLLPPPPAGRDAAGGARALIADPRHGRKGEGRAKLRAAVEREGLFVASSSLDSDVELLEISRDDAVGSSE